MKHLPNILTLFRIVAAPIYFYLFFQDDKFLVFLSTFLFLVAALTDYYDGKIARETQSESKLGAFLDPISDKVLINTAFLSFYFLGILPIWMFIAIVFRDLIVTIFKSSYQVKTSFFAKRKTAAQFIVIALTHLTIVFGNYDFLIDHYFSQYLLNSIFMYLLYLMVTIFTILTLIDYLRKTSKN